MDIFLVGSTGLTTTMTMYTLGGSTMTLILVFFFLAIKKKIILKEDEILLERIHVFVYFFGVFLLLCCFSVKNYGKRELKISQSFFSLIFLSFSFWVF